MGVVIPFPNAAPQAGRFTSQDRNELTCWQVGRAGRQFLRAVAHAAGTPGGLSEHDFILIYEPAAQWASWGLARTEDGVLVWECAYGNDLGMFRTVREALAFVEDQAGVPESGEVGNPSSGFRHPRLYRREAEAEPWPLAE